MANSIAQVSDDFLQFVLFEAVFFRHALCRFCRNGFPRSVDLSFDL